MNSIQGDKKEVPLVINKLSKGKWLRHWQVNFAKFKLFDKFMNVFVTQTDMETYRQQSNIAQKLR